MLVVHKTHVVGIGVCTLGIGGLTLLTANGRETFLLNVDLNWRVLALTMATALLTGLLTTAPIASHPCSEYGSANHETKEI
jgi:hypothetical protein